MADQRCLDFIHLPNYLRRFEALSVSIYNNEVNKGEAFCKEVGICVGEAHQPIGTRVFSVVPVDANSTATKILELFASNSSAGNIFRYLSGRVTQSLVLKIL